MSLNLDKFLSEMPLIRLNGINALARTLATTVNSTKMNDSACATQHPCKSEETVILVVAGDCCPSRVEVDCNNVLK